MGSDPNEQESSAEEEPVARKPRPWSSKNRESKPWAQQHFEDIRNEGHSRTHIGNAYNTYHVAEQRHEPQQKTLTLTLSEALAFPLMRYRHDDIAPAYGGSCEWLFQTPTYNRWRDRRLRSQNYGLWWIKGSPGTGNSTILKELLKRSHGSETDDKTISYFFDARVKGLATTARGMYQSLLFQMVKDSPHLQTTPTSEVLCEYKSGEWPLEKLKELFRDAISSSGGTSVACYIDAVDESQDESGGDSGQDILRDFEELAVFAYRNSLTLRVCISSRILSNALLLHSEQLVLNGETGHVAGIQQLAFNRLGLRDHELKLNLANCIASSSYGDYRWAIELVRTLNKDGNFKDPASLHMKLETLIATTKVFEDEFRLKELQSRLTKIWPELAKSHLSAQSEAEAVPDATSDSPHQISEPKPSILSPGARRSIPRNITVRLEETQNQKANSRSKTTQRSTRSRPSNADADVESSETYTTSEGNEGLPKQRSRRHELRPGTTKRTSSPGDPPMSRLGMRRSETSTLPASENTSKPAHRPYTTPPQSSRPSGSRSTKTVSVGGSDISGVPSSSRCQPPADVPEASPPIPKSRGVAKSTTRNDARATKEPERLQSIPETANGADTWFYYLRTYSHALLYSDVPKNPGRKLVRVAIIDSGLATASKTLPLSEQGLRWIANGHVTYKDFTGGDSAQSDNGPALHGTWCASLLMQTAPNAELYVANVGRPGKTGQKAKHVAAAIAWAIEHEVDIISMSFGWRNEQEEVDEQIDLARRKGVLLFAAASNDWDLVPGSVSYPAFNYAVCCVYSCSGLGHESMFNPRSFKPEKSFMFPGEDITILEANHKPTKGLRKSGEGGVERRTGISYATPIAAGTAAMLLDLARQEVTNPRALRDVERRLKKVEGMSAVLQAMSGEPQGGVYYHVRPWILLGKSKPIPSKHNVGETHKWHALMNVLRHLDAFGPYAEEVS
jgi:hypothetical protein